MLDLKFVVQNAEAVQRNIDNRFLSHPPVVSEIVELYREHHALHQELDGLRRQRNENAAAAKSLASMSVEERETAKREITERGKKIKETLAIGEQRFQELDAELQQRSRQLPNMTHPAVPVGKVDSDNEELYVVGRIPEFDFVPKGHLELMQEQDWVDFENAARVTGAKHYYLKNEAVFLELSLTRFAADILQKHGFSMCITPDLAREEILTGIGFQPRGEESNTYMLQDDNLCLIGTAEITLGGMYSGQIIDISEQPILLGGLSHCFRKEAGASGQYSKGLYRVHQFSKVEMFVFCKPEDSEQMHRNLLAIEEEVFSALEIPYRVLDICTGDLGAPAYRKFDLEAWMPGRGQASDEESAGSESRSGSNGEWGEITSASNCTDYQARRLSIRYRNEEGKNVSVHTLNGTAIALSRAIIAIIENHQQADGSVRIPKALQPYMGRDSIGPKDKSGAKKSPPSENSVLKKNLSRK
ncbi:serine--tRNA ligase [Candidatus Haliotispira prima]|uniref:Serine--tRNA ligase n=1 Tax=Candidatus Haliotispira prima TaxID=3034016 RepID=A0ABY8MJH7_9SPIO|nr:serine--tRNA ligase [Candidatus Haliotispira prima]